MKFCTHCGSTVILQIPVGDDRERFVCSSCDLIHYTNPRVIVGTGDQVGRETPEENLHAMIDEAKRHGRNL